MMAEALLLGKQTAPAETWLMRAIDFEKSHDDRYFSAEVHRLSAVCLAVRGDTDGARGYLHKALEISRTHGATLFELRAALTLAEHDVEEALAALRSVMARFSEPEPWPEVKAAQRILAERPAP